MTDTRTAIRDTGGPARITPGRPRRVLVIDEEALMRTVLARYLPRIGYDAVAVRSCREACALMDGEPWDVVVMSVPAAGTPSNQRHFVVFRDCPTEGSSGDLPLPRVLATPFHLDDLGEALRLVGAMPSRSDPTASPWRD